MMYIKEINSAQYIKSVLILHVILTHTYQSLTNMIFLETRHVVLMLYEFICKPLIITSLIFYLFHSNVGYHHGLTVLDRLEKSFRNIKPCPVFLLHFLHHFDIAYAFVFEGLDDIFYFGLVRSSAFLVSFLDYQCHLGFLDSFFL